MEEISISLKALFDKFGERLENGMIIKSIDGDCDYYDLQTKDGIVCMDGESCRVLSSGEFGYELLNTDGEEDMRFILTKEEFDIAAF